MINTFFKTLAFVVFAGVIGKCAGDNWDVPSNQSDPGAPIVAGIPIDGKAQAAPVLPESGRNVDINGFSVSFQNEGGHEVINLILEGIQNPLNEDEWLRFFGTGTKCENIWLTIDGQPKGISVYNLKDGVGPYVEADCGCTFIPCFEPKSEGECDFCSNSFVISFVNEPDVRDGNPHTVTITIKTRNNEIYGETIFENVIFDGDDVYPDDVDSEEVEDFSTKYFLIEDGEFVSGEFPQGTTPDVLSNVNLNDRILQGGMNFITITTDKPYSSFFVGIEGTSGYWVYTPSSDGLQSTSGSYVYSIPVLYGTGLSGNLVMLISGKEMNGEIDEPYETEVKFVDSQTGDLNINLTFSNNKDVDLHLYTPSGEHIFYGKKGGTIQTADGRTISYGLDKDSNAGCRIDGLNNENIFLPAEKIESGVYTIVVDMFSNCNAAIATNWSIVARYQGNIIEPISGVNPASGVYPVGAGNGDMTQVMQFSVEGNASRIVNSDSQLKHETFVPFLLDDMARMKLEKAGAK